MPHFHQEASWWIVLDHAFRSHWQFGVDLIFTFGPYGFLYSRLYHPESYGLLFAGWLALTLVSALALAWLLRPAQVVAKILLPIVFALSFCFYYYLDVFFFSLPLLLLFLALDPRSEGNPFLVSALLLSCALSALIKFSFAPLGLWVVLLLEAHRLGQQRRVPWYLLGYACSLLVLFATARQELGNLPAFLQSSLKVAGGYSESMQLFGPPWQVLSYLFAIVVGLALATYAERTLGGWRGRDRRGLFVLLGLVAFAFMSFKAGFVRHGHADLAWGGLVAAFALYTMRLLGLTRTRRARLAVLALGILVVCLAVAQAGRWRPDATPESANGGELGVSRSLRTVLWRPSRQIRAAGSWLAGSGRASIPRRNDRALARIRKRAPLPPLKGGVDIYPWHHAVVLAHGFELRTRPVFESFVAYDPWLVERNRSFLRGDDAAETLLFGFGTIDNRLVAMDEGASWLDLISLYDPIGLASRFAILRRREQPRDVGLIPEAELRASFGQKLVLPVGVDPLWSQMSIEKTLMGHVCGLLFKMPILEIVLDFEDGTERRHRLVPGAARGGFLLAPPIDYGSTFQDLWLLWLSPELREGAGPERVVSITILGSAWARLLYHDAFPVELSRVAIDVEVKRHQE
jgi:hypothetical protein